MSRKYFSKNQSDLQRRVMACGLSTTFSVGMFSNCAGAMQQLDLQSQAAECLKGKDEGWNEEVEEDYKSFKGSEGNFISLEDYKLIVAYTKEHCGGFLYEKNINSYCKTYGGDLYKTEYYLNKEFLRQLRYFYLENEGNVRFQKYFWVNFAKNVYKLDDEDMQTLDLYNKSPFNKPVLFLYFYMLESYRNFYIEKGFYPTIGNLLNWGSMNYINSAYEASTEFDFFLKRNFPDVRRELAGIEDKNTKAIVDINSYDDFKKNEKYRVDEGEVKLSNDEYGFIYEKAKEVDGGISVNVYNEVCNMLCKITKNGKLYGIVVDKNPVEQAVNLTSSYYDLTDEGKKALRNCKLFSSPIYFYYFMGAYSFLHSKKKGDFGELELLSLSIEYKRKEEWKANFEECLKKYSLDPNNEIAEIVKRYSVKPKEEPVVEADNNIEENKNIIRSGNDAFDNIIDNRGSGIVTTVDKNIKNSMLGSGDFDNIIDNRGSGIVTTVNKNAKEGEDASRIGNGNFDNIIDNEDKKLIAYREDSLENRRNVRGKIVKLIVVIIVLLILFGGGTTVVLSVGTGSDNQNGNKTGNQPDGTNSSNNMPEQTGNKVQQNTEQKNSDNTQVASNEGSSSVFPTVLKVGGTAVGTSTVIAGSVAAACSARGSNNQKSEANKKTPYTYVDLDKAKAANAENEGKDDKNKS